MTIFETIDLILANTKNIPELDEVPVFSKVNADLVNKEISKDEFVKILRLQTLKSIVRKQGTLPSEAELKEMAIAREVEYHVVLGQYMAVEEDARMNELMIELFITHLVRHIIPTEANTLGLQYAIDSKSRLVSFPTFQIHLLVSLTEESP